jgi:hypothetical protein
MITVGGISRSNITSDCDWESMGVAILDLTLMSWGSIFDSVAAPYQVNSMISEVIGGGLDGNATRLLPAGGWTSIGMAQLFTGTSNQTQPYSFSGTTTKSPGTERAVGTKIGAIVGGTLGGVVLLAMVSSLAWFLKRRREKKPFKWWTTVKGSNDLGPERFEKPELPATASSRGRDVVNSEGFGITPEVTGTPVGELTGQREPAELEERRNIAELEIQSEQMSPSYQLQHASCATGAG